MYGVLGVVLLCSLGLLCGLGRVSGHFGFGLAVPGVFPWFSVSVGALFLCVPLSVVLFCVAF